MVKLSEPVSINEIQKLSSIQVSENMTFDEFLDTPLVVKYRTQKTGEVTELIVKLANEKEYRVINKNIYSRQPELLKNFLFQEIKEENYMSQKKNHVYCGCDEAIIVQWAINEYGNSNQNKGHRWTIWSSKYQDDILITPNFAKRINEADMGNYLKGYTLKGELITVKIGARYW